MMNRYRIFGNSLTALITIDGLSKDKNNSIEWVFSKDRKLGGHFAGTKIFDRDLDFGMVALEVDEPVEQKKIFPREPLPKGPEVNSYLMSIKKVLINLGMVTEPLQIKTWFEKAEYQDFFISNHLNVLTARLTNEEEDFLRSNFENKNTDKRIMHPKNKNKGLNEFNLGPYLAEIYGNGFISNFIVNYGNKISDKSPDKIAMIRHRSLWLPIYYPETIIEFLESKREDKNIIRNFFTVKHSTFAAKLNQISEKLKNDKNIQVNNNITSVNKAEIINIIESSDSQNYVNIYADDELSVLAENYQNTEMSNVFMVYVKTDSAVENKVVFDADPDSSFYRLTSRETKQDFGFNYICLETKNDLTSLIENKEFKEELEKYIESILGYSIKINQISIKVGKIKVFTKRFISEVQDKSKESSKFFDEKKIINLSTNALNNSMNEQILLALWYIEKVRSNNLHESF
jgi:hypothetical protein